MAGLTSLYTAVSGMNAAQAGLYVTGHNMANVDTVGYTRQRTLQVDARYQRVGYQSSGMMKVGLGTGIGQISQLRNKYLDTTYRQEATRLNFYTVKYGVGVEIETIIGELQSAYKAQTTMQDIWDALNELSLNPTGVDTRGAFITAASKFIDKIDTAYKDLTEEQYILNDQVKGAVASINEYISEIRKLNIEIAGAEASGDRANDYRDTRNNYLDELSRLLDIDYKEDPRTGMVNIYYEGTGMLVSQSINPIGLRYTSGECSFVEPVFTTSKDILSYDPYTTEYQTTKSLFNMTGEISANKGNDTGSLKAMLMARGTKPLNYSSWPKDPPVKPQESDFTTSGVLDDAAFKEAVKKYNIDCKEYEKDKFNATQATIPKFQKDFDTLVNKIVTLINDTFAPYVLDSNGKKVQDPNAPYGQDGSQHTEIFVRKKMDRYDENGFLIEEDTSNFYSLYTIGNIEVNPIFSQPAEYDRIALSAGGDINDTRLLLDLLGVWQNNAISFDDSADVKMSIEDYYRKMVTDLGIETSDSMTYLQSYQSTTEQADSKRMEVSAVSLDEEMTNMLKYQHAYNAAARVFNVIDGMLDKLINGTGRVGL